MKGNNEMRNAENHFDKLFLSIKELLSFGYSYYQITKLTAAGKLRKLNRTNYENLDYVGEKSDFYYATVYAPQGVICLLSAAVFWQLSTHRPIAMDVALPRKRKLYTKPSWPKFDLYYFDEKRYNIGVQTIVEGMNTFKVYDPEKTVIDVLHYREKIGIETVKEVLTHYLSMKNHDLNKLYHYASQLNTAETLRSYLEILL